jgi:hypothetical protein
MFLDGFEGDGGSGSAAAAIFSVCVSPSFLGCSRFGFTDDRQWRCERIREIVGFRDGGMTERVWHLLGFSMISRVHAGSNTRAVYGVARAAPCKGSTLTFTVTARPASLHQSLFESTL